MTTFPTALQDLDATRGSASDPTSAPDHAAHHALEDATIEALQTKLGINSSADTSSIDYLLKSLLSIDPGHKHTATSLTIALSNLTDVLVTSPADGNGLIFDGASGKWKNSTTSVADASATVKGVTKLSVAPASPTAPIAVGDNDPRLTTASGGATSATNPIVDVVTLRGAMVMWGTAPAPTGWLLCDGSAVSRTTYAALFAILSTTYGVGDGSTTFNLPDLRGRVPVGKNAGTFSSLGGTGGEETHTLTAAEIASHTHNQFNGAGSFSFGSTPHFVSLGNGASDSAQLYGNGTGMQPNSPADGAHNNLQPYLTLNFIIKF
jgi:microcystin-dependent protein